MTEQEWRRYFRRNLRVQLRQKGWTQKELAIRTGMSEVVISRYINCTRTPSSFMVFKMADAIGCTVNDLALPNG